MEKKYMKPEIDIIELMAMQQMMAASMDALIDDDTQDNPDALIRMFDQLPGLPFDME